MHRNRRARLEQTADSHREALRQRLQQRMEVARAKGDDILMRQLEQESSYLN